MNYNKGSKKHFLKGEHMNTAEVMEKGWFKMPRTFDQWPWYQNSACVHMYLHLMMRANYKPKEWEDTVIERGELVTSIEKLSMELNLSVKQVRNILDKLQKTNFIERKGTNKYTRIKILNYEVYQSMPIPEGQTKDKQRANEGQTEGNQRATTKEIKKEEKDKKDIYYGLRGKKNFFTDYDDSLSEFEIELMRERINKYRE